MPRFLGNFFLVFFLSFLYASVLYGQTTKPITIPTGEVEDIEFSPDGNYLAIGSSTGLELYNATIMPPQPLPLINKPDDWVGSVAFSPDSSLLAVSFGKKIEIWNVKSRVRDYPIEENILWAESVAFSPDSTLLAFASENIVWLWNMVSKQFLETPLIGHKDNITSIVFSPDGKFLASGSVDNTIKLWDMVSKECIDTFEGHTDNVLSITFSPDGRLVASGSSDNTIRLWDIESRKSDTLSGHTDWVSSVSFSPGGNILASGSWDKKIRLWNVKNKECIEPPLEGHTNWISCVVFSPESNLEIPSGKIVASGSGDGRVIFWDITPYVEPRELPPIAEVLSPVEGSLEVVFSLVQCSGTKWCFNQHKSIGHKPKGGICQSDDTYAWDANLNTPIHDSDAGKPVYAVEQGVVCQKYGGSCTNAGGSYGQLLIEHNFQGRIWWSGYLHLKNIQVVPGQIVTKNTVIGYISDVGTDNNHLHFVLYKGQNNPATLISFDAKIIPRDQTNISAIIDNFYLTYTQLAPPQSDLVWEGTKEFILGLWSEYEKSGSNLVYEDQLPIDLTWEMLRKNYKIWRTITLDNLESVIQDAVNTVISRGADIFITETIFHTSSEYYCMLTNVMGVGDPLINTLGKNYSDKYRLAGYKPNQKFEIWSMKITNPKFDSPILIIPQDKPDNTKTPVLVGVGQLVKISMTFTNTSNNAWQFIAGASIWDSNGVKVADYEKTLDVPLQPGSQTTVSWDHIVNHAGDYWLQFAIWKNKPYIVENLIDRQPTPSQKLLVGVTTRPPDRPTNILPKEGATGITLTPILQSSSFSDLDTGDMHTASQWQVTTIPGDYSAPVFDSGVDTQNLVQITIPSGLLAESAKSTTYHWHVRYQDSYKAWSEWSRESKFATKFQFVLMTDVHIGWEKKENEDFFGEFPITTPPTLLYDQVENIISAYLIFTKTLEIVGNMNPKPAFLLITGDNVECGDEKEWFDMFASAIDTFQQRYKTRVYFIPGNHDRYTDCLCLPVAGCWDPGKLTPFSLENYRNCLLSGNPYWSVEKEDYLFADFEHNGYRFIGLDSGEDKFCNGIDSSPEGSGLGNFQIDYIDKHKREPKIIFMHHPAIINSEIGECEDGTIATNRERFINYCKDPTNKVKLVLSGHTHKNHDTSINSLHFIQTASTTKDNNEFKHGYRIIKIIEDGVNANEFRYGPSLDDMAGISEFIIGPVKPGVFDSKGGYTGSGSIITDIPNSYYTGYYSSVTPQIIVSYNLDEEYKFKILGVDKGSYSLVISSNNNGKSTAFIAADIPTSPNTSHQYVVDWDSLSQGEQGVTVQIDSNGDGTFEDTVTTDSELTKDEFLSAAGVTTNSKEPATWGSLKKTSLLQNFPNPANPETWIPFEIAEAANVLIHIYDANGHLVRKLNLGYKEAGVYNSKDNAAYWDGKNEVGEFVPSGIYFYQLQAGKNNEIPARKMTIIR